MYKKENVTAVILAGGRATRMGGQDKGLLNYAGRTFVEHIAASLAPDVSNVVINANRNLDSYEKFGCNVVVDTLKDFQGPLAGMYAGLCAVESDWIVTAPCDGPFVATGYVTQMLEAAKKSSSKLAVASDGEWLQPVYALIHRDLDQSLRQFLDGGERKIDRWYNLVGFAEVRFTTKEAQKMFINVNTPEQLKTLTG